jgi:hypothetical protein
MYLSYVHGAALLAPPNSERLSGSHVHEKGKKKKVDSIGGGWRGGGGIGGQVDGLGGWSVRGLKLLLPQLLNSADGGCVLG